MGNEFTTCYLCRRSFPRFPFSVHQFEGADSPPDGGSQLRSTTRRRATCALGPAFGRRSHRPQELGRLLGRGRVDVEAGSPLEARHPRDPGQELDVPVEVELDGVPVMGPPRLHPGVGSRVEDEVERRVVEGPDAGSHLVVDQYDGTEQLTWHVRRTRRRVDQPSNVIPGTRFAAGEAVQFYRSGSSRKEPGIYLGDVRGFPKWCWVQPGLTERPGYSSRRLVVPVQDVYELPDSHRCPDCQQKWHKKTHPSEDEDRSEGGGR